MDLRPPYLDRRRFLAAASAWATVAAAHGCGAGERAAPTPPGGDAPRRDPLLSSLELLTSAPLPRIRAFYDGALGLRALDERPDRLTFAAGQTRLTFLSTRADGQAPFYHFAFNIPENKIRAAREWQRLRGPLLPIPAGLRDPGYPDDVVHYRHWNAHSVFFFDPAGNVVEYIARHDLACAAPGPFGPADILYASEIALVVDDVSAAAAALGEAITLRQYRGGDDNFRALGDERGLVLVMRRGRVISFDAEDRKAVAVFRTTARVRGARRARYRPAGFPYEITAEA